MGVRMFLSVITEDEEHQHGRNTCGQDAPEERPVCVAIGFTCGIPKISSAITNEISDATGHKVQERLGLIPHGVGHALLHVDLGRHAE